MIRVIKVVSKKIMKYYKKLYFNTTLLYAIVSILNPSVKLSYFNLKVCKLNT